MFAMVTGDVDVVISYKLLMIEIVYRSPVRVNPV